MPSILDYQEFEASIVDITKEHIYSLCYDTNIIDGQKNNYFSIGHKDFHFSIDQAFVNWVCSFEEHKIYLTYFEDPKDADSLYAYLQKSYEYRVSKIP